jgi:hypothetical protein
MPPKTTIDITGSKKVAMLTTGYTSARITAVLCCSSEGRKIDPLILASKTTLSPIDRRNVLFNSSGYMTEDVMISWISDYFLPSIAKRNNIFVLRVETIKTAGHAGIAMLMEPGISDEFSFT